MIEEMDALIDNGTWDLVRLLAGYVARTRVRVSDISTYLRVRFVNFQNLEYGDMDDKYPNFGYRCGGVIDKYNGW